MAVDIIKGTDREFTLRIVKKSTEEPFDLTGLTGDALSLRLPTESGTPMDLTLVNLTSSALVITSALGGKILVIISDTDTALLKAADNQNMELTIKQGAGSDFYVSVVQFPGSLNVKKSLFE